MTENLLKPTGVVVAILFFSKGLLPLTSKYLTQIAILLCYLMRDFEQIFGTRDELSCTSDRMIGSKYNIRDLNYIRQDFRYIPHVIKYLTQMNKYFAREIKYHTHGIKYLAQQKKYLAQEIKYLAVEIEYLAQEIKYLAQDIIANSQSVQWQKKLPCATYISLRPFLSFSSLLPKLNHFLCDQKNVHQGS